MSPFQPKEYLFLGVGNGFFVCQCLVIHSAGCFALKHNTPARSGESAQW